MSNITYKIVTCSNLTGQYKLVSIVPTNFGGNAINFIASGTYEECEKVLERIKAMRQ